MANYRFQCRSCDFVETLSISIEEFLLLKPKSCFKDRPCAGCRQTTNFVRIFHPISSKIVRDNAEILADIKEDVRRTVNDVRAGNTNVIREIYGEDL